MNDKLKKCLEIFMVFFRIGAFTFGGGYAMLPLIQNEVAQNRKWISDDDILDIVAIAESTPGPFAINSATFVGYKTAGVLGALSATCGVVLPSLIVITIIAYLLNEFQSIKVIQYAFVGIRAGVLALILKALISMYKQSPKGWISYVIMVLAFIAVAVFDVNVLFVIISCAIIGVIYSTIRAGREEL